MVSDRCVHMGCGQHWGTGVPELLLGLFVFRSALVCNVERHCPHRQINVSLLLIRWSSLCNSPGIRQHFHPLRGAFFNCISEMLSYWDVHQWQKGPPLYSKQATANQEDDRGEEREKRRHVKTHSFLQLPSQILKVFALCVFQNLAVLHISQLHVPAEDLRWRAELLAKGGFWSGVFDWVERSRRESSVWSGKLLRDG